MNKFCFSVAFFALCANQIFAQTQPQPTPPPERQIVRSVNQNITDLTPYGVRIQPDARLIIVMAALDAAGFNPQADSQFHQRLRTDLSSLDPNLRRRLHDSFTRNNKTLETATLTDQAARYVSLAYSLSPAPELAEPARTTELPAELLEVLDFAPLVREFYRQSGIDEKLSQYTRTYQLVGDDLRPKITDAISEAAAYLNTRPQLTIVERVKTTNKDVRASKNKKKPTLQKVETSVRERAFYVVPDLLAVPNSVKFRVIGDNYFAIIGSNVQPQNSSELRRAYLQFLIDPIIYKNAREIAAQRDAIRSVTDDRIKSGATASPDVFLTVSRSFVAVADIRERKQKRIAFAMSEAQSTAGQRSAANSEEVKVVNNRLTFPKAEAEAFAELSEAFENGAVLAFFFDEQLRGLEASSFDITSSFAEMIAAFDAGKEKTRLTANATARKEALIELAKSRQIAGKKSETDATMLEIRSDELIKGLNNAENLLKAQDYNSAENNLKDLLAKFPGEPRVLYALGRTASLSATGVFDEGLRDERLKKAAAHYLSVINLSSKDTPPGLLSNTHVALGKIYEFYADENAAYKEAATKQFEAAIALGKVENGSYPEAVAGKARIGGR